MKRTLSTFVACAMLLSSCAPVNVPGARNLKIPTPTQAMERRPAVNERPDAVMYLPLGEDVLIPQVPDSDKLPQTMIGPFELRTETLAGALQLMLSDYDIPLAFETQEALTRTITVSNMRGPLDTVVKRICGLADLYCSFEEGVLVVKETQTFTVSVPPVGGATDIIDTVAAGIQAITGQQVISDIGTRTIIYAATQRSADMVNRYFQRMRNSTALIVFEVYIWEVTLDSANASGIDWEQIASFGTDFSTGISIPGSIPADFNPISIGLPTKGDVDFATGDVFQFISQFGAVKTISQPQITMLSGSEASLRAADTINYVSSLERTIDDGDESVSTQTDSVDTGFTLTLGSNWDNATVYSNIDIELQTFQEFDDFDAGAGNQIRLPITTERQLVTQVRVRPGDSLLIAGLVRESDQYDTEGPGIIRPIVPSSRSVTTSNVELVFLMRPRVIVYTGDPESGPVKTQDGSAAAPEAAEIMVPAEGAIVDAPLSNTAGPVPVIATGAIPVSKGFDEVLKEHGVERSEIEPPPPSLPFGEVSGNHDLMNPAVTIKTDIPAAPPAKQPDAPQPLIIVPGQVSKGDDAPVVILKETTDRPQDDETLDTKGSIPLDLLNPQAGGN